jgi:hypothetical protein
MSDADEPVCIQQRFQVLFAQEGATVSAKSILRTSAAKSPLFAFHEELARRLEHFRVFTGVPQFDINSLNKKGF